MGLRNKKISHSLKRATLFNLFFFVSCVLLILTEITTMALGIKSVPEAQQIALESSGELLAPEELVQRIEKDLVAIRAKCPAVADVKHTAKWQPGRVMVQDASKEQLEPIVQGSIGPGECKSIFQNKIFLLTFEKPYNSDALAEKLKNEFNFNARPDGIVGGSTKITLTKDPSGKNTYEIMKGWGDCMAGCINKHFWTFTVGPGSTEAEVELVKEEGDDPSNADAPGGGGPVRMGMGLM